MKKSILLISPMVFIILGIFSCKKDKDAPVDFGYSYFPNEVGRYVIYDVDSIFYEDGNINSTTHIAKIDTFQFQLKEKIESIFMDNQNRPTIRLERYVRFKDATMSYTNVPWQLRNVWAENRTTTTAEKVEENERYVKLIFPVKEGQSWNGNAQNSLGEWDYFYDFVDRQRTIASLSFDSVLNVSQHETSSLIGKQSYSEKYARNVGLIYKSIIDIQSQPPTSWSTHPDSTTLFFAIPITNRVTGGGQFTMTVNAYGKE